jgi:hypothetical protein
MKVIVPVQTAYSLMAAEGIAMIAKNIPRCHLRRT